MTQPKPASSRTFGSSGEQKTNSEAEIWPMSPHHARTWSGVVSLQTRAHGTLHALWQTQTNTATQSRPWHQTPRSEPRSFTATLQPECIFPQEYREKTGEAILKGLRRELLPQFVILDRKPKKQTGWELTLKWGEAT